MSNPDIKLAKFAGFCYGVKRAVETAIKLKKENPDKNIYILGELIHNTDVINELEKIEACVKNIVDDVGAVDGLVYAAGINNDRPLQLFKPGVVSNVLNVNLCGFIEIIRCLTKKKNFNPGMRIVGISSTSAIKGTKAHVAYSASKAGMDGAVRCLARELSEKGICVNTVAPGMIRTDMYYKYLEGNGGIEGNSNRGLLSRQYLGIGESQDVAAAIAFLLSESSRFITGICLPVDGGLTTN